MSLLSQNNESINHSILPSMVDQVLNEAMRVIFKQEWNKHRGTIGAWDDTVTSGELLFNLEKERPSATNHLATFQSGDTSQWDCNVLFDAILFSNALGIAHLSPGIREEVDKLRELRNKVRHFFTADRPDHEFEEISDKIRDSLNNLGLIASVNELDKIKMDRKRFPSFKVLPPQPAHDVIFREETVSKIAHDLENLCCNNDGKLTYLYLSGNAGSGKSQIARQTGKYYYNNVIKNQSDPTFVMTLDGKSLGTLLESFQDFARRLNCPENVIANIVNSRQTKSNVKIKEITSEIRRRIKRYKSWLIIVDNVENMELVAGFLPQPNDEDWGNGQVLVTTQHNEFIPRNSTFTSHLSVSEGMGMADSCRLLATISKTDDHSMLAKVAKKLDYQPLALAAAAVYMEEVINVSPQFSWPDYIKKLEQGKRKLKEAPFLDINNTYSPMMKSAVLLSTEMAAENDQLLSDTFRFLSLCSYESLPLEIVVNYVLILNKDVDKEEVALRIQQCPLILTEDQEAVSLQLNRVVHNVFKVYATILYDQKDIEAAIRSFYDFRERNDERKLVPHLKSFCATIANACSSGLLELLTCSSTWYIVLCFGYVLLKYGEFFASKQFMFKALRISEKIHISDGVEVALCYRGICDSQHAVGKFREAAQNQEKALNILIKQFGRDHTDVADSYDNFGMLHKDLGDLPAAKKYYDEALAIRAKQLGPYHTDVADSYKNLGQLHQEIADLEAAKEYFEKALAIHTKELSSDSTAVASSYTSLGILHRDLGDLETAKQYFYEALAIHIKFLGLDQTDVAVSCTNLGILHRDLGDLQTAMQYFVEALAIYTKQLGPDHIRVADSCHNLGVLHHELADFKAAMQYFEKALSIRKRQLTSDHIDVAASYNRLGALHKAMGDLQAAKEYFENALAILTKQFGPEHIDVATSYSYLGKIHQDLSDLETAKLYYKKSRYIYTEQLGEDHTYVLLLYTKLAIVHRDLGDQLIAMEYYENALRIRTNQLHSDNGGFATSCTNFANLCKNLGHLLIAKEYYEKVLAIRTKQMYQDDTDVVACCTVLEEMLLNLRELQTIKDDYKRNMAICIKQIGPENTDVAASYNNLGDFHQNLGDLKTAKEYYMSANTCTSRIRSGQTNANFYKSFGTLLLKLKDVECAKQYFERVLVIYTKRFGPDQPRVANCYIDLGKLLIDSGDMETAKDYFEKSLAICTQRFGADHDGVAVSYFLLGRVLKDLGDMQTAKEYLEKALAFFTKHPGPEGKAVQACYFHLGKLHMQLRDHGKALEYLLKAKAIFSTHEPIRSRTELCTIM